jgi:hypothetical protein
VIFPDAAGNGNVGNHRPMATSSKGEFVAVGGTGFSTAKDAGSGSANSKFAKLLPGIFCVAAVTSVERDPPCGRLTVPM